METNSNLEQFLKNSTEGFRMKPSSKVWDKIEYEIHGKKRTSVAILLSLFIVMTILGLLTNLKETPQIPYGTNDFVTNENTSTNRSTTELLINEKTQVATIQNKPKNTATQQLNLINNKNLQKRSNQTVKKESRPSSTPFMIPEDDERFVNQSQNIPEVIDEETVIETNNPTEKIATLPSSKNEPIFELKNNPIALDKIIETNQVSVENTEVSSNPTKKTTPKKSRVQYFITPSISYRVLDNKFALTNQSSSMQNIQDLDKAVFHKPAMGFEAGAYWIKNILKPIHFKIGLQLNYNRYNIKVSDAQPEVSTITLRATNGASYNQTLNTVSTLRNAEGGFFPKWVENSNLQVSIPLGFNFQFGGSEFVNFGIGTTIQPSYLLKNKILLLSTDLKNYTKAPSLINRFNLNTGLETFINVKHKKTQLQFGPSIRYQLLSTYNKKYPFKENLFDYGFRMSISRPL